MLFKNYLSGVYDLENQLKVIDLYMIHADLWHLWQHFVNWIFSNVRHTP